MSNRDRLFVSFAIEREDSLDIPVERGAIMRATAASGGSLMNDRLMKTERLIKIWLLLAGNPTGYTIKELAEKCGVNIRTVYRDMLALGEDLKIPVYNDRNRWKMNESRMLPPIRFTLPEALNIFLAARLMLSYSHRYDPNVDATFTKLCSVLPPALSQQVRKTMDWMQKLKKDEKHMRILATVAEAWVSQRRLKIAYRPLPAEKALERIIEPYYIEPAAPGHASYVIGYCHLKNAIRTFKMERIESAELTNEHYMIPADFDANDFFGSSWGIVVEGEVKTVRLRIEDRDIIRIMQETIWHPSQMLERQQDGSMIMTLRVTYTVDLYSWILRWGEKVEVLEPPEIRQEIMRTAKATLQVYRE
jgi:predicted DNA-binding transcriptional regulator YafY